MVEYNVQVLIILIFPSDMPLLKIGNFNTFIVVAYMS